MNLSIRTKLFLTLLIASILSVLGMQAFMQWSFRQGLMEFAEERQQQRLERIQERLVERYREDGGWGRLSDEPELWIEALTGRGKGVFRGRRFHPPPPPDAPDRGHRFRIRHQDMELGVWPPTGVLRRARDPDGPPMRLEMRLMLLDVSGEILYGRQELLEKTARFPLRLDGERIGDLALIPGPLIPEIGELRFRERQTTAFVVIALGMILLSAIFAYPLSKRLSRPLLGFRDTARRLAGGDFDARVPATGNDELGRLGRDINSLAETLERNENARRRWVADISHELRTPLALLRAELEALQDGVRSLDRGVIDSLHTDVLRLGRLVDDLYELSMSDLGALTYRKSETDLAQILEDDLDAFRSRFAEAGLELRFEDRLSGPAILQADQHRLSQLFRNLLRNSLQYTDPGGGLWVTLDRDGGDLVIDFQDSSPGVPPQSLPQLFERLYRVEVSRSRNAGGAGLGLAICKNIVEAHGGTIDARHASQGGLWIRIRLPMQP
jgi:two-component system sensor histidine kinase BaeS